MPRNTQWHCNIFSPFFFFYNLKTGTARIGAENIKDSNVPQLCRYDGKKNVVYKISCKQCEVSYVGQTKRTLATRVKEHSRSVDAAKTSLFVDRKGKNDTGLPAHCLDTDFSHRFDFDNAEVLCRETHWGKRLKKEAMYIAMVENTCNIQKGRDLNPIWLPLLRHFS